MVAKLKTAWISCAVSNTVCSFSFQLFASQTGYLEILLSSVQEKMEEDGGTTDATLVILMGDTTGEDLIQNIWPSMGQMMALCG